MRTTYRIMCRIFSAEHKGIVGAEIEVDADDADVKDGCVVLTDEEGHLIRAFPPTFWLDVEQASAIVKPGNVAISELLTMKENR